MSTEEDRKPVFLSDGAIFGRLRESITRATSEATLIAPYVEPSSDLTRQLIAAAARGVDVTIIFRRDKEGEYRSKSWFKELSDAGVYFQSVERLHAKIFLIDDDWFVGSMNLTATSWNDSREFAVQFPSEQLDYYMAISDYFESLLDVAQDVGVARKTKRNRRGARSERKREGGFCIRCGSGIPLNSKKPYCPEDYAKWAEYSNEDYKDKHCHQCGKSFAATMKRPLCKDCFSQQ